MKVDIKSGFSLVAHKDAKSGIYFVKETNCVGVAPDTLVIVPKSGACKSIFVWNKPNKLWDYWEKDNFVDIKLAPVKKIKLKPRSQIGIAPTIQSPFPETEVAFDIQTETKSAENGIGFHQTHGLCIINSGRFFRADNGEGIVVTNEWTMMDIDVAF